MINTILKSLTIFKPLKKTALLALPACLLLSGNVYSATLFFDDFNGSSLDETAWRLPTGDGTFYGRTQIKPPEYQGQDLRPVVANGSVTLQLDTYNPSDPSANSFFGQEIQTRETFLPGAAGITIETRMRFLGTPAPGLVGGFFTWGYDPVTGIRDEIDVELLTNIPNELFTNLYNDDSFADLGDAGFATQAGFDITNWNTYAINWLPDRVQWLINGTQVREVLQTVDGHPSEVRLNIWAPDPGFNAAYNSSLQPTDAAGNMEYELEIDYVQVSSTAVVPVPAALWLFASGLLGLVGTARRHRKV